MSEDEVRRLMEGCCELLRAPYPFPEGSTVDARLAYTIGLALGVLVEGLEAHAEDRPVRWVLPTVAGGVNP